MTSNIIINFRKFNSIRSCSVWCFHVVIILLCFGCTIVPSQGKDLLASGDNSKCNLTQADQAFRWLFLFGDPERIAPDNEESFDKFCNDSNKNIVFVKEFARKCMRKFPSQMTNLLMYGIVKKNQQCCTNIKSRKEFIHSAKCINAIKSKGSKCFERAIHEYLAIRNSAVSDRISKTCCVTYQLEDCLIHAGQETTNGCTARDVQLLEDLIEGYVGQVVSSICQKYPRSQDHCTKVFSKKEMTKLKKLVTAEELNRTYSILPPLIEILDDIPP